MPINASHEYFTSEKEYLAAQTEEDKIYWLEELIRTAPKHKGSENLLAGLKSRLKKLKEKAEKGRKKSGGRKGIRKEGYQCALVGKTNSGKSSLLKALTNATPKIAEYSFTTQEAEVGTMEFGDVKIQVVDLPSIGSENFDKSVAHTADCLILVIEKFEDLKDIEKILSRSRGKRIAALNKADKFNDTELRKAHAGMKSKRIFGVVTSAVAGIGLDELKEKIFSGMGIIRVYTKEPGKKKTDRPIVLAKGATVRDVAEKIKKGLSGMVREARVTGPSSKFANQKVGLGHVLKDLDIVELHIR